MSARSEVIKLEDCPVLDEQLCFALYTATHRITRAYRPLLEPLGLTYVQYLVLLVLWEQSPRSVGELGHSLFLDSGTLTPLLKRMERNGFIKRTRDADDERRVLIELTEHGHKTRGEAAKISENALCQLQINKPEAILWKQRILDLVAHLD
ncbi:MAG: MarR family transcriptional regulator [Salinisphaera sp.]|jgi:DNA-binding MarR family transcriptional regulator|nr:MarR family transcriptional regulator [Salinisphaera sp.]